MKKSRSRRILKVGGWAAAVIVGLGLLLGFLVSLGPVQSWLVEQARWGLEQKLGVPVELAEVDVDLPARAVLRGVNICDLRGETLIGVEELRVSLFSFSLWRYFLEPRELQTLEVAGLYLRGPELNLYRYPDGHLNLDFFLQAFQSQQQTESKPGRLPFNLAFPALRIEAGRFSYLDGTRQDTARLRRYAGRLNPYRIQVEDLALQLSARLDTSLRSQLVLDSLRLYETHSAWGLDQLSLRLTGDSLRRNGLRTTHLRDLRLVADGTRLAAEIDFPDQSLRDIARFDEDLYYEVTFAPGNRVDFATLDVLSGEEIPLYGTVGVAGQVNGSLKSLVGRALRVRLGDSTRFLANVAMTEILKSRQTRLDAALVSGRLLPLDLERLLMGVDFPPAVDSLRTIAMEARFIGGYFDFDTRFNSNTELGQIAGDLHLTLPPLVETTQYQGRLSTQNFNVDALRLSSSALSRSLNFNGLIQGRGLTLSESQVDVKGLITQSDLGGYAIDTVRADVALADREVKGQVYAFDGQGRANLDLDLDLSQSPATYIAQGTVDNLPLHRYGLLSDTNFVSTYLDLNLAGDSLEALVGNATLLDTRFRKPDSTKQQLHIPDFRLRSELRNDVQTGQTQKYLGLSSSLAEVDVTGAFTFGRVARFLRELRRETDLFLGNQDSLIAAYYAAKTIDTTNFEVKVFARPQDSLNRFFAYFAIPAYFELERPAEAIEAVLSYSYTGPGVGLDEATLRLGNLDTLSIAGVSVRNPSGDISLAKGARQNVLLLSGGLYAEDLYPDPAVHLSRFSLNVDGDSRDFISDVHFRQNESNSQVDLAVETQFLPSGHITNQLLTGPSLLVVRSDTLDFVEADPVVFMQDSIWLEGLKLANQARNRFFEARGIISPYETDSLALRIDSFDLGIVNQLADIGYELNGIYNAQANLRAVLGDIKVNLASRLYDFSLDGYPYGDLDIFSEYLPADNALQIRTDVIDGADTTLLIRGQYRLAEQKSPLDFELMTRKGFPLSYITPFVEGELYGIEGRVGLQAFTVTGTLRSPVVRGVGFFEQAGFGVSYFKTQYILRGRILFDNDRITMEDLRLQDRFNSASRRAYLHGNILHNNLREFRFDLQVDSVQNFLLMDTRKTDNDLFYGTLYLQNALADITGDLEKLSLNAIASFGRGSVLKLPLTDNSTFGRPDFIVFESEKGETEDRTNTGLQGYEISLTTLLDENLEVELIFDERVGDIIRGRGEGNLNLQVDESGAFSMFGRFEVTQGDYLFTSQNVINKKFEVVPGGTIIWTGDPYTAQIDLDARYPVMADIRDIVGAEEAVRVPTNVMMHLEGSLEQPEISLAIEINNLNETNANQVVSYIRTIQNDEQELNKQVFSLMAFNRFAPAGFTSQLAGAGVTSSISELLSNQFNYWFSQVTNDKVNVNVNASNFQDINLLISAKLFNDRVTIERDGAIPGTSAQNGTNTNTQDQLSNLLGDISILVRLLPSEKSSSDEVRPSELVLEVFNRNSLTETTFGGNNTSVQTGLGIFYKKDFDQLQELLRRRAKAKE